MGKTLFDKVWQMHTVKKFEDGVTQLFVGLHYLHEVTSPQAFQMLKEENYSVLYADRTIAVADHIVPTDTQARPLEDQFAEEMLNVLENNTKEYGITLFGIGNENQGIVHVTGPELGLTQPGMTIACGDSHTCTHGAFGTVAFGIGTSQVKDVLATQTLLMRKPKIRKIEISGRLRTGVTAKDIILYIIGKTGVNGGTGYAYEFCGNTVERMSMDERMTLCNMSVEGGARFGYINPDKRTYDYLKRCSTRPRDFDRAVSQWQTIRSDQDARYDDALHIDAGDISPMVTWGINPGQVVSINSDLPVVNTLNDSDKDSAREAYAYMGFDEGTGIKGTSVDVAFIGSCTNGRLSDLRSAASVVKGKNVADGVRAIVVPGSEKVKKEAEQEGLDKIFLDSGFEWRSPGCSMCLAMNPDKLKGREVCASTSNRNFIGRQGSKEGRTLIMSPAMVAAAAVNGEVVDVREI